MVPRRLHDNRQRVELDKSDLGGSPNRYIGIWLPDNSMDSAIKLMRRRNVIYSMLKGLLAS